MAAATLMNKTLDLEQLRSQTGHDDELAAEILTLFAAQLHTLSRDICSSSDAHAGTVAAHTLVGSARSVGAHDLAEIAHRIECDGLDGLADKFTAEVERVLREVRMITEGASLQLD